MKIRQGGWVPLTIAFVLFILMTTWNRGREIVQDLLRRGMLPIDLLLADIENRKTVRVPGLAVFMTREPEGAPVVLLHHLKHNKVLHETNLFVTVKHHEVPWLSFDRRCQMEPLGNDCWQVTLNFGFKNEPDVPEALGLLRRQGCVIDDMDTSYFLSRDIVSPSLGSGMAPWREKLFAGMHRNASAAADFLRLPTNRVVELGSKLEI